MCSSCWHEMGRPNQKTANTDRLVQLIRDLYAIHPTGGPLHVVLDDWNVDGLIEPAYGHYAVSALDALYYQGWPVADLPITASAVVEGLGRSTRSLCDEIAELLTAMTIPQRYAALALSKGIAE